MTVVKILGKTRSGDKDQVTPNLCTQGAFDCGPE